MARTHKGGGPPRQSQSSAAQLPSSTSSAAVTTAAGPSSSAQRSPLKPDSASSAAGAKRGVEQAKSGRQTVVLDAAMIRALVGDTGALRGRQQGPSGKAAEVEHVGFKYKFKPSSVTNQKPGTFTLPSAASSDGQHAVVHLQGANKAEVHGFAAKVEEMSGGAGRDVMLVWDESSQTYTMSPIARTYNLVHDKSLSRSHLPTASPFEPTRNSSAAHPPSTRPVPIPAGMAASAMDVDVDGGLASSASSDSSMHSVGRSAPPPTLEVPMPTAMAPANSLRTDVAASLPSHPAPPPPMQNGEPEADPEADAEGSTDDDDDDDEDDDFAAQLEQELAALSGGGANGGLASSSSTASVVNFPPVAAVRGSNGQTAAPLVGLGAAGGLAPAVAGRTEVGGKRPVSLNSLMGVADNESDSDGSSASSDSD